MTARITSLVAMLILAAAARAGTPPCHCPGDADGDGIVSVPDLLNLLAAWGDCNPPCPPSCPADFDASCTVDIQDLLILLANWGPCVLVEFPDPGPSMPLAHDLEIVTDAPIDFCEFIGAGDTDVFRFELTETRAVNVALTNRVAGIDARIIADLDGDGVVESGETLETIETNGSGDIVVSEDLVPGVYHIVIDSQFGAFTAYSMRLSSIPLPSLPVDPGESLNDAYDLGVLDGVGIEEHEVVGGFDSHDIYRFTVAEARTVNLALVDRTEGIDYTIVADLDGDGVWESGETLETIDSNGSGNLTISEDLAPGVYHIVIRGNLSSHSTRYTLLLSSPLLLITPVVDPGESLNDAYDLGVLDGVGIEEHDVVGGFDSHDIYRFTVAEARAVVVSATDRTEGADLRIIEDLDGDGFIDSGEIIAIIDSNGSGNLVLNVNLMPGVYHIVIRGRLSSHSTRYTLGVTSSLL